MKVLFATVLMAVVSASVLAERQGPWTKEKAWQWQDAQPWYRGCNYMPASAANFFDVWQSYGSEVRFAEVEREFALAKEVGFNAMRILVVEHGFCVWLLEPEAFRTNFERYLVLMEKYGLKAFVVLGNDCSRPKFMWSMPKPGEQPYDLGYHGGRRRTQHGGFSEPGYLMVDDPAYKAKFFEFCHELVTKYAHDRRVAMWELWNEPGAGNRKAMSASVLRDLFRLCWQINPDQPLTANIWGDDAWKLIGGKETSEIGRLSADLSDVISYHGYVSAENQVKLVDALEKRFGRPLYNTEWLVRTWGCEFSDNYAFMARRKVGAFNWGFVNGKYQTHEPYEPMWKSKFEFGGDPTRWFHDLFRISHHPYDPYEIAVARNVNAWAEADARGQSLRRKIARAHKITGEDMWHGFRRTKFDFDGRAAWIVEPSVAAAKGAPWTWTMQGAEDFVDRTGVLTLLKEGWHHATIDLFATRMDDAGVAAAAKFQRFLVDGLGLAPKANLIGLGWGGFFATRYAAARPDNVARIYYDAPLLDLGGNGGIADSRMPVNLAGKIAAAKIPILLLYGGQDQVVNPALNCELFLRRFKDAGGVVSGVEKREFFGHHPHGLDPGKTDRIVRFFKGK